MAKRRTSRDTRSSSGPGKARVSRSRRRSRTGKRKPINLSTPVDESKLHTLKIGDFYRPLKKPITVRIDADVLAWFKKDGRRYQTRINRALRSVMEREMKASGG